MGLLATVWRSIPASCVRQGRTPKLLYVRTTPALVLDCYYELRPRVSFNRMSVVRGTTMHICLEYDRYIYVDSSQSLHITGVLPLSIPVLISYAP